MPFTIDVNGPTIVTTIVPLGSGSTHTICPHCYAEIDTATRTEPGMIAYISGFVIALLGYAIASRQKAIDTRQYGVNFFNYVTGVGPDVV